MSKSKIENDLLTLKNELIILYKENADLTSVNKEEQKEKIEYYFQTQGKNGNIRNIENNENNEKCEKEESCEELFQSLLSDILDEFLHDTLFCDNAIRHLHIDLNYSKEDILNVLNYSNNDSIRIKDKYLELKDYINHCFEYIINF